MEQQKIAQTFWVRTPRHCNDKGPNAHDEKEEANDEIDTIGGLTALTLAYRRTSAIGTSPFTVTQYHVPVGKEKVLITLSYRESDGRLFGLIFDRVKRSVTIK